MKYLIIGTGGTGGCIGGFLASNNNDVTFISRGKNLEMMKENGLKLKTGIKGELYLPNIKVFSDKEYTDKADVIFVCVKSYSIDDIIPIIRNASHENSIIIPIMNGYGMAEKISKKLNTGHVLDGCIYISAFIDESGSIIQLGNLFRIVFGTKKGDSVNSSILNNVKNSLCDCGIEATVSDKIERDTFKKFTFISSYASCAAYYDIPAKEMQQQGKYRETFKELCEEIKLIGNKLEIELDVDITEANLKILDSLTPDTTASIQKDMEKSKKTEIDGLIFEVVRLSNSASVSTPMYSMIAKHFGYTIVK
ncbi:ketopantoate reductase family protein [Clostridium sp.]|uniref:ketopantoate reductase family protein n=1 Tax=Clostridium sp. TaxID=1506 RepID=UPI001A5919DA|nr:2-dehydropantoate 2-reductase [Clostridium sp.]MBK5242011.1 2-dehydropantoate 2-reductase [Clostridium sp.]